MARPWLGDLAEAEAGLVNDVCVDDIEHRSWPLKSLA